MSWDDRYFKLAKEISTWSKDPSTRVGAVIIGDKGQIISQGFNGFPRGIEDTEERYNNRDEKYKLIVHAEANAIYNAIYNGANVCGASIYIYGMGICHDCAKVIIQCGIATVHMYRYDNDRWKDSSNLARTMFKESGIKLVEHSL